ncbi:hypothetical protein PCANC_17557 [Puccinia coronata f. sp. avenae]|uniref:Uncharacterized protein n=1 Tax=Puccinia coronata f. sp. avenae TaxID=200324 RepID=A0A2N5TJS2_9BASI|nr:hypothetical protein PCASD_17923 [Puccinia coronata f. sp. avenae]PLW28208.1 hypothetical protein PCANC_21443 [Puccinia coronata f. sp. avenae]PLW31451.1 hypothetical protein PCANC_17557 [Puccinia coronata f. sp. avenae]
MSFLEDTLRFNSLSIVIFNEILPHFNSIVSSLNAILRSNSLLTSIRIGILPFINHVILFTKFALTSNFALIAFTLHFALICFYHLIKKLTAWRWSIYDNMKEKLEKSQTRLPHNPLPLLQTLGIYDSVITFSHIDSNDYDPEEYDYMIETCINPKFPSKLDHHLLCSALRKTGDLTRRVKDNLEQLAIRGFHTMLMFAFEGEEDNHSPFDDDQIENQLENLLLFIRSTKLLNEKLSKEIQKVDEALGRIICILEKTEGLHKLEFDSGVPFRRSLIRDIPRRSTVGVEIHGGVFNVQLNRL